VKSILAIACVAALLLSPLPAVASGPDPLTTAHSTEALAPGIALTSFERLYPFGWVRGYALEADLSTPGLTADLLTAGAVTAAEKPTVMAGRAGAIAAVNGDFFDINNTKAPLGPAVAGGTMMKSAPAGTGAAGVGADRIGRLADVLLEGKVTTPYGTIKLAAMNQYTVPGGGIGLYTPEWSAPRAGATYGATQVCEAVVRDGKAVSAAPTVKTAPAAAGTLVLVGREEGAAQLCRLKAGDSVTVTYAPAPALRFAVGGGAVLVRAGQVPALDDRQFKPRSAIGFTADGRRMWLVTVDGRSEESGGLTLLQLARLMKELGAADALELDGGGSAQMVARRSGQVDVINVPSDGVERPVPNAVGLFVPVGSGKAVGMSLRAPTGSDRVFPGLTRRLAAAGYDEQLGPAPLGPVTWTGAEGGVARGGNPGVLPVRAAAGALSGVMQLKVLGPLARIEADLPGLRLAPGQTGKFRVMGYDADGYGAPIEPADVSVGYLSPDLQVEPGVDGYFRVRLARPGQAVISLQVQGKTVMLPIAAGTIAAAVTGFENARVWAFHRYPVDGVTGAVSTVPGRTRSGLQLSYAFGPGATRAAYAVSGMALPGRPIALGLWVDGDGKGAWLRAEIADRDGARRILDLARQVDWTGWRYLEAAIPSDLEPPIRLERIYAVETTRDKQYSGSLRFDDLLIKFPVALPEVPPAPPLPADPMLRGTAGTGWAFALVTGPGITPEKAKAAGAEVVIATEAAPAGLDWKGVRFLGLQTGTGSLRTQNFAQIAEFRRQLDAAAVDPTVKALVVTSATPPSRYADVREAELIRRWLAEFRESSGGKPVAYLAGGDQTLVRRYDGVAYVETAGGGALVHFRGGAGSDFLFVSNLSSSRAD